MTGDGIEDLVLGSPAASGRLAVLANDGAAAFSGQPTSLFDYPNFEFIAMAREVEATVEAADSFYALAVSPASIAVFRTRCDFAPPGCDGDGVPDSAEIAGGALDANANGIPDSCDCPVDFDQDGRIGAEDLSLMLFAWGMAGSKWNEADVTRDGIVDTNDLSAVFSACGGCPNH